MRFVQYVQAHLQPNTLLKWARRQKIIIEVGRSTTSSIFHTTTRAKRERKSELLWIEEPGPPPKSNFNSTKY